MRDSQTKKIYAYLQTHRTINPDQAKDLFACNRLASRISDIKHQYSVDISTRIVKAKTSLESLADMQSTHWKR